MQRIWAGCPAVLNSSLKRVFIYSPITQENTIMRLICSTFRNKSHNKFCLVPSRSRSLGDIWVNSTLYARSHHPSLLAYSRFPQSPLSPGKACGGDSNKFRIPVSQALGSLKARWGMSDAHRNFSSNQRTISVNIYLLCAILESNS